MKYLRHFCVAAILTLAISITAPAGDLPCPGIAPPLPSATPAPGQPTPPPGPDGSTAAIILALVERALTLL